MSAATLRASLASARSRMRIDEAEARRTGAAYVGAAVIGVLSKRNDEGEVMLEKLAFWGLPGTVTLAIAAKAGASFASGDVADYMNGLGDAASVIAISNFVQGRNIAGAEVSGRRRRDRLARQLRARLRDADDDAGVLDDLRDDAHA